MGEFFLPIEFVVIGTSLTLHKSKVSSKEVYEYIKRLPVPLEYSDEPYRYITFDEKEDIYTVLDNIPLHPSIRKLLTSI